MRRMVGWTAATLIACLWSASAQAAVVYFHEFNGSGTALHGQSPTVDGFASGNTWVTRTHDATATGQGRLYYDDGRMQGNDGLGTGTAGAGSATLAFTPNAGQVYTLSASFGSVTAAAENWIALGFTAGQSSAGGNPGRFIADPTSGQPWVIYRGSVATNDDLGFAGPGTATDISWSEQVVVNRGDPVDLRIVLDTRPADWTAEWFAKNPGDASYTSVGFHTYAANPTIGAVGIALANGSVVSSISSFELTVVPEPGLSSVLTAAAMGLLWLRRRGGHNQSDRHRRPHD